MKVHVREITNNLDQDNWFKQIIMILEELECSKFLTGLTSLSQKNQRTKILSLQEYIVNELNSKSDFKWEKEYKSDENTQQDSIDIYGASGDKEIIIELDKWRADQVAKKIISRTALFIDKKIGLVSLCYGGTQSMNMNECIKYFKYANTIQSKLNNFYAGIIID